MRIFAIPDIHGKLDLLNSLLDKLSTEEKLDLSVDKIVFLGDMIDRGSNSKGVLDKVRELTLAHPNNVIALGGNHEWLAIDAHTHFSFNTMSIWLMNGGDTTLESFGAYDEYGNRRRAKLVPDEYIKWMASLPFKHEEPGFFFSHAPVPEENCREIMYRGTPEFSKHELMWTYLESTEEKTMSRHHANGVIGVCGHIHRYHDMVDSPRMYDHYIFADSGCGCYKNAPLVAVEVYTRKVIYARPNDNNKVQDKRSTSSSTEG